MVLGFRPSRWPTSPICRASHIAVAPFSSSPKSKLWLSEALTQSPPYTLQSLECQARYGTGDLPCLLAGLDDRHGPNGLRRALYRFAQRRVDVNGFRNRLGGAVVVHGRHNF